LLSNLYDSLFLTKAEHFHAIGVSYKTAAIDLRGQFSLNDAQLHSLFLEAKTLGLRDLLVINTCNRTELFSWTAHATTLVDLLCRHSNGTRHSFDEIGYAFSDADGFHHLFRVGTGLESQILGDFEIIGQIKQSFYRSKKMQLAHGPLERLTNAVIQASKRIKTETKISSGATSVAFASVQYILQHVPDISTKNIVLFGTGKIGANTCENLVKHTQNEHIVLINRTLEKAEKVAGKFPVRVMPFGALTSALHQADVLIVATGAQKPTITAELIHNNKPLLILDLSIPRNVSPEVEALKDVQVTHLDALSQITDATFEKRKKHIPKAESILEEVKKEFLVWLQHRRYVPTLKAFKEKIALPENFNVTAENENAPDHLAQKITGQIAAYLRSHPQKADETVALLQEVFQLTPENFH